MMKTWIMFCKLLFRKLQLVALHGLDEFWEQTNWIKQHLFYLRWNISENAYKIMQPFFIFWKFEIRNLPEWHLVLKLTFFLILFHFHTLKRSEKISFRHKQKNLGGKTTDSLQANFSLFSAAFPASTKEKIAKIEQKFIWIVLPGLIIREAFFSPAHWPGNWFIFNFIG